SAQTKRRHLITSPERIAYSDTGYRLFTPWENVAGLGSRDGITIFEEDFRVAASKHALHRERSSIGSFCLECAQQVEMNRPPKLGEDKPSPLLCCDAPAGEARP